MLYRLGGSEDDLKQARWKALAEWKTATMEVNNMERAQNVSTLRHVSADRSTLT